MVAQFHRLKAGAPFVVFSDLPNAFRRPPFVALAFSTRSKDIQLGILQTF
jgi:hypothetical protein